MSSDVVMIDDPRVVSLVISENSEPLVDVRRYGIGVIEKHPNVGNTEDSRFSCRRSVAERLRTADQLLGARHSLAVAEAHRPLAVQQFFWDSNLARVRAAHSELNDAEIATETAKFVAPPWIVPPHTTGGAVDVVVLSDGEEIEMGCALNERCAQMATRHEGLEEPARKHRAMLVDAMDAAGLVNYGHEWWHYSYGDRYWAFATGAGQALYGAL